MKAINVPTRQPVPFATSGTKNTIPATQPAGSPGRASYSGGFPNETMQPIAAGGTPPFGQDFNGLFFDVTNELRWAQSGGTYTYDSAFSTAIGGYPAGAVLKSTLASVLWISTADDNTTDPDGGSAAGWVAFRPNSGRANLAVVSGDLTPTAAQKLSQVLSVTGDATGLTTTLRLPLAAGTSYLINNATTGSGATLNVQGATGTGVAVGQGQATVVFTDGTNYYAAGASGGPYLPADGTAVAATKLATARAFNLSGVITASAVNFDGTGNVTLATAIADGALSIAKTNGLQTALDGKLSLGGGSLTGGLTLPQLSVSSSGSEADLFFQYGASAAHRVYLSNSASGFFINFTDAGGAFLGQAMTVDNTNGKVSFGQLTYHAAGLHVSAGATAASNGQGAYIGWNKNTPSTNGETDFINHKGGGLGGHAFWNTDGATYTLLAEVLSGGVLRVVNTTANPGAPNLFSIRGDGPYGGGLYLNDSGGSQSWAMYCVSGSLVIGSGAINGGAITQRLILSPTGNLTVQGTGNFQGSDERLKDGVQPFRPRPLHRTVGMCSFTMRDTGTKAKGLIAQVLKRATGGDYVDTFQHADGERLSVNYSGTALEIAMWAANEVDRINTRARLERWVLGGAALAFGLVALAARVL